MWFNPNINTYLFSTTGLHEGWKKFMQLENGNECRCAPSHSFIFKQAVTTKQPASVPTQPMWSNPNINICLSNTMGLHKGWKKVMQLEYGNWCRVAPSHCYTLSKQLQPNNLQVPVYKLWQCNPCGETQTSTFACPILRVCIKVGRQSCSENMGIDAGSLHLTAILQAGNCNQTTWQYTNWDNATHVVQPKHQHVFVQYHWFARRLGEKQESECGNECRFAPSHNFISKQAVSTKQLASIQVVRNCANATHVEQPKYQHCLSNTTGLHQGWKKVMQL